MNTNRNDHRIADKIYQVINKVYYNKCALITNQKQIRLLHNFYYFTF